MTQATSEDTLARIAAILAEKKTHDPVAVRVGHLTVVADWFVICGASSTTAVRALAEAVDEKMSEAGMPPLRTEGLREGRWAALDFGTVIVHIFLDSTREVYQLEKLWSDGENVVRLDEV